MESRVTETRLLVAAIACLIFTVVDAIPYRVEINHPWPDNTIWGGFNLVVTNFILLPFVVLFVKWARFDVAAVLFLMCVVSSGYHMCRAGFWCALRFRDAQVFDHLCVYTTLMWVSTGCIVRKELFYVTDAKGVRMQASTATLLRTRVALFFLMCIPIQGLVLNNPESAWVNLFGFGIPVSLAIFSAIATRTHIFCRPVYGWTGMVLFGCGVVFYSLCPSRWYDWAHSIWHVFSMIAVPLIAIGCDETLWKN